MAAVGNAFAVRHSAVRHRRWSLR